MWALREVEPVVSSDLDVVINGRNLGEQIDHQTIISAVRGRGGVLLTCPRGRSISIHR
ncbi:MAG: hypothetical protein QOI66_33 [Myxococcales bacterium]|jgi:hypothetical protein|nr:hypothetical protein [Myxococcales bacterium]